MMVSPGYMKSEYKKMTYEELIKERDNLLAFIKDFEDGKISEEDYMICPGPDVVYQMNHEYLAKLAPLIARKYREKMEEAEDEEMHYDCAGKPFPPVILEERNAEEDEE
ncbi:MAG: hypothetical protein K5755_04710 [Clostridiales bacterium]|nr:hypothetical protein [Clostridiales bacterium]